MKVKIDHMAVWVMDLDRSISFYTRYFNGRAGEIYENPAKGFSSCFISFSGGARLELMRRDDIPAPGDPDKTRPGWAHISLNTGTRENVKTLTEQLRKDGYRIYDEPRMTGDGYFESVIVDFEGNKIEITV